jgi:hypothetical protein
MADEPTTAADPAVPNLWRDTVSFREQVLRASQAKRRKIFKVLLAMLVLVGGIMAMLLWLVPIPQPYFAGAWITDYQSRQMPPLLEATHDRDAFRDGGYFLRHSSQAFQSVDRAALVQELNDLGHRSAVETVVLYLAGHARVGGEGEVQVLPADADPDRSASWLPLRHVLEKLRDCPARSKLLVLDILAPSVNPRLGILTEDVGRGIERDLESVADPHRLTLCACSPGQVALASAEMGRTVFSYYLEEGLRGWADGYGGHDKPDRRVAVRELADFVAARVDRWAWRNREARQTPVLYGSGDFYLRTLPHGKPEAHLTAAEEVAYPTWLSEGWKMHDAWQADEVYRTMPHLYRELEMVLLAAELEWQSGIDPTKARDNRAQQIKGLRARKELFRYPPQPEPYSLALADAQGPKPDKEATELLREVLGKKPAGGNGAAKAEPAAKAGEKGAEKAAEKGGEKAAEKAAPEKPAADAAEKLQAKPHIDVATAAFDLIAADTDPKPDKIRKVNAILQAQEPRPRFVETLFLARLGELAGQVPEGQWPKDTVRRALDVVRNGERAASRPEVFAWIRGQLDEASQHRLQGETLLFSRGYAALDEADEALRKAATAYDICLAHANTLQRAQHTLDDAFAFLPAAQSFVEHAPRYEKDWLGAARLADELSHLLTLPAGNKPLANDELRQKGEEIRNKTDELAARLDELRRPFAPAALAPFKDVGTRPDTSAYHLQELDALLATPFLKTDERLALWKAARALARRLHEQTRSIDEAEDAGLQSITSRMTAEADPVRLARVENERAARRARLGIGLVRLGGLPATDSEKLDKALDTAVAGGGGDRWYALGQALRRVWTDRLPALIAQQEDVAVADRLSRVFTFGELGLVQRDSDRTPQIAVYQQQARALWAWLADRNRYAAHDALNLGLGSGAVSSLHSAAARSYQQFARGVPEEEFVQMIGTTEPMLLPPGGSPVVYPLQLRLFAPPSAKTDAVLRVLTADDAWLQVTPEVAGAEPGKSEVPLGLPHLAITKVPLRIELKAGAAGARVPPPQGVLVEVRINGRTYHHRVPVSLNAVTDRLEVLLSANPETPAAPQGELRLRPVRPRQPFFLYVRNPTAKPRNLVIQLLTNDKLIDGAETKLAVGVKETRRVVFPQPAAPPLPPPPTGGGPAPPPGPAELPELTGPLEVRLLDADNRNAVLERKLIPVGVATPREYIQVTGIQWLPGQPPAKNRLTVNLRTLLSAGPPCQAELVLLPERIPGLREIKDGNLRSELPFSGEEVKLYAEGLLLRDGDDEDGWTYLTIDGCIRALVFRTTFARSGDPSTPREDSQPALRLRAPQFGRTGSKLPVTIEVDNPPAGATLDVALGTVNAGAFEPESARRLPTGRQTRIGLSPSGPGGALLFEAMIQDWHIELDTLRIKGPRALAARLADAAGNTIRTAMMTVVLDDNPADKVQFIELPAKYRNNVPLVVKASAQTPVAGIKEVNFYFGKAVDNKPPAGAQPIAAVPIDQAGTTWAAKLPLAGDRKGPTDISVEFKSMVGLSSFATATIELLDPNAAPEPGKIEGKVNEGGRAQGDLDVVLRNEKNEEKGRTKTGPDGSYRLDNVEPGKYKIIAMKVVSNRRAEQAVVVEPGQTVTVDLTLIVGRPR